MQALTSSYLEHICISFTIRQRFWKLWRARQLWCTVSPNVLITLFFTGCWFSVTLGIFEAKSTLNNLGTHCCRRENRHNFWRREHFQAERSRNSGGSSWIRRVQSRFSANNYLGISVLTNSRSWKMLRTFAHWHKHNHGQWSYWWRKACFSTKRLLYDNVLKMQLNEGSKNIWTLAECDSCCENRQVHTNALT